MAHKHGIIRLCRKLARTYSDRQVLKMGHNSYAGNGWWVNGFILLWDDCPTDKVRAVPLGGYKALVRMFLECKTRVYPAELYQTMDAATPTLRLSDGNGTTRLCNARYISTILKRAGKDAEAVKWYAGRDSVLAIGPNGPLGYLMQRIEENDLKDWSFIDRYPY